MKIKLVGPLAAICLSAVTFLLISGCASGNSSSGNTTTTPTLPAPTVTSISPAAVGVGAAPVTLTVNGTNFQSSSVVQVAGVSQATTYVSATQLQATVPASLLGSAQLLPVAVFNGSASSIATPTNLEIDNPSPAVSSFSPNTLSAGSASASLVVAGSGFVFGSSAQINASARPTTYISSTQISVSLTTADLAASGTLALKIVNPAPGGGSSTAVSVSVLNPAPAGLTLSPSTGVVGAAAVIVTVAGTGFVAGSVVNVNGVARATTFVDSGHLTFSLTAADQTAVATFAVTVTNPAPGGGTSPAASLAVSLPTPTPVIATVNPNQFIIGASTSSMMITGTGFTTKTVVQWNGTPLTTSYTLNGQNVIYMFATVPASLLTSATTASVTAVSPTATPSTSNAISVSVTNPPPPTITAISPNSAPLGTATPITVSGTGFTSASTISFNGTALTTTYSGSNSLTATIPASALNQLGNSSITVTTPAPGGGTTAAVVFTTYVGIVNNSMIYNPVNGLLYVSVPSSAGPPYGNSVVSVDPATGAFGTPIFVGSEPDQLALTADGRYLWVGLDGSSAVRKVDLVAGTAGLQFGFGQNAGIYNNPPTVLAMVALPNATDSVVIQLSDSYSNSFAIYDSGVARGAPVTGYYSSFYALQADGTRKEIYAAGSGYSVYTYGTSGLTLKNTLSSTTYASSTANEIQIAGGDVFTDFGQVDDAESGALLGTFYLTGSTAAVGPTTADIALGKAFVLDNSSTTSSGSYNQIQIFNLANYTQSGTSVIPVSVAASTSYPYVSASRLTRWGKNGLAFRTSSGIYSLRSNLVQDLSTTSADLSVTLSSTGNTTGSNTTYTATVLNSGPSAASSIALNAQIPSTSLLVSATTATGSCSAFNGVTCNLGALASGSSAVVTIVVTQTTAGSAVLSAQVTAPENDPNSANNQASSTITVTGSAYNLTPVISSISPASIQAGSTDTVLTVNGSGFASSSVIQVGGTTLPTNVVSSTKLTTTVPTASLATLGWTPVTVSTPAPGGGSAASVPLSIFNVITLGVNHIVYDPYSRKIMASVGSGSSTVTGNSIVAITPETGTVGTPVNIGSQPTSLALTSDGQILYTILSGSQSIARFNMLTGQADFTYAVPANSSFDGGITLRGIAAQPGTENTIALDIASFSGNAIYDFDPTTKTAAIRGQATGPYTGSCIQFLDANDLLAFDTDTSGATLDHYPVTSAGFSFTNTSTYGSTLNHFGCFKLSGGLAFANAGGIANPATTPATQIGVFQGITNGGGYSTQQALAPDISLQRAFFVANTTGSTNYSAFDGVSAYDPNSFFFSGQVTLNIPTIEGTTSSYSAVDLVRWGQDGLALLTSGGHIYLLRGGFVVPQLLNTNTAPGLTSISSTSIAHGTGNTLLTLTGSNFVPGVAVTWNGDYRTTTIVDATHVTVAIPAADLASAGTASLVATNPGSSASSALTLTIN